MSLSKKPYKGTRDFFPADKRVRDYLFSKMKETAELFAYESYDGPLLEEVELYKAKSGEELINDQIYSFTDRGDRFVAIRPEMTPTVARMVASVHREIAKPIRWFSIPNLYRYERPQRGRLREHWQFNVDIFGASGQMGELEILQVAIKLMESFGATSDQFEILLNDRSVVDHIFKDLMKCTSDVSLKLYKLVDKHKKLDESKFEELVTQIGLAKESEAIFYSYLEIGTFSDLENFLETNGADINKFGIFELNKMLNLLNLDSYIIYDPTIVRGLDYYTGIVFEVFDKNPENRRAICGGGSYANILKIFNEAPLPGVGLGLGDVTLRDFLETHNLLPDLTLPSVDIFLTTQEEGGVEMVMALSKSLRDQGISVLTQYDVIKMKKVFSLAQKKGASFVALIGEDEIKNKTVQIKNLNTKNQSEFSILKTKKIKDYVNE